MSRRTETAYKAKFPGELAQHNEALGSRDTVREDGGPMFVIPEVKF